MHKIEGLEYEVNGDGEPVLLIHGALIADAMLPLTREPALVDRYRLIRYRRRGHGGSDPVIGASGIKQQARDARALLEKLGVERAHVVGHSGGGTIALELALEAPNLVHSLALLEPAVLPPAVRPMFNENVAPVLEAHRSGNSRRAVDLWMNSVSCGEDWRSVVANTVPGGAEQAEKDAATFFDVEVRSFVDWVFDSDRANRISQPILYVLGADSGPLFDVGKQHFLSLIPHVEEVVLPGVNHSMQMGNPKRVAQPIADFLSRHPL